MPAKVTEAFERAASALFGNPEHEFRGPPKTACEAWNRLAAKFPDIYPYAASTKKARETEEKLSALLKKNAAELAVLFARRMETDESDTFESALESWWRDASRG